MGVRAPVGLGVRVCMKNEVVRTVWISHSWPLTGFYCSPGAVRETAHGCNTPLPLRGRCTLKKIKKEESDASLSLAYFILFKKHYFIPLTSVGDPDPDPQDPHVIWPAVS